MSVARAQRSNTRKHAHKPLPTAERSEELGAQLSSLEETSAGLEVDLTELRGQYKEVRSACARRMRACWLGSGV
jgi:hypothetical protein